jgi:DNA-directed RNA polymerase specialized sigma subunit
MLWMEISRDIFSRHITAANGRCCNMNAKEYLSQALWLDQRINSKLEQLETLRALAMKVSANLTEEKVSGSNNIKSHMENTVVKIVDLEKEINEDIDRLVDVKAEIMETISQVDDPICQLLLEMRYISGKAWEEVARELNYNDRSVFKIHGRALKKIKKIKRGQ